MRFITIICGILVLAGGLGAAQTQYPYTRQPRRPQPADPNNLAVAQTGQNGPAVTTTQQFPARPAAGAPQPTPTPPLGAAAVAAPAPVPQAPENLPPPTPAQVTYHDGLLTVQAMNSTLGGLLTAIRNKTGIQFEGLEGANERVAISMGPAPEGEVLAAILGGSNFDYVVLGRPDSPGTVQRVLLTPRGGATTDVAGQPSRPIHQGEEDDEDAPEEQASGDPEPQDTPVRPPVTQQAQQPLQPPPNQVPPTPEEVMQRLMQMRQQQEQQQQQQQQQQVPQSQLPQNQAPIKPPPSPQ